MDLQLTWENRAGHRHQPSIGLAIVRAASRASPTPPTNRVR
jgi:hypothetical protein